MIKTCKHCQQELPLEAFRKNRECSDGYLATCKACYKAGVNKRPAKIEGMHFCPKCKQHKSALDDSFPKFQGRPNGYCRECWSAYLKERWQNLPIEQRRAYDRRTPEVKRASGNRLYHKAKQDPEWLAHRRSEGRTFKQKAYAADPIKYRIRTQANRARRAEAPGEFTKADVAARFRKQNGCCLYCDKKICPKKGEVTWHCDHFIPLSRGGSNSADNIVVACTACNLSKHNKMPWEFMPERFPRPEAQAAD